MTSDDGAVPAPIARAEATAYTIPTDQPESDGTLRWTEVTIVVVEVTAGGRTGLGYSYTHAAASRIVNETLADTVSGISALDPPRAWSAMRHRVRNLGREGVVAGAISAVDVALWDLKARLLDLPLARLLGMVRDKVPAYGSGGFTSYGSKRLQEELGAWADLGFKAVKMKVGRYPDDDVKRVRAARDAVGKRTELFVDANGAFDRKQALKMAEQFAELDVSWYEEPVSSDDLEGMRLVRDRAPSGMRVAAGEYGWELAYFRRMLEAGAVDVLQADATRCLGITGLLHVAALAEAHQLPLSTHTAPSLHLHPACSVVPLVNTEYFIDHARIEELLFEGAPRPRDGQLIPDLSRPGMGLEIKRDDAAPYAA